MAVSVPSTLATWRRKSVSAQRRAVTWWHDSRGVLRDKTAKPRQFLQPVTDVITPTAWALLATAMGALVVGLRFDWTELVMAGWFSLALLTISVGFILGSHQLTASLDLSRDRVVVGEKAYGGVHLINQTGRRTLPLTVELQVGEGFTTFDLPSLKGHGRHDDEFAIPTHRRAVWNVGPVRTIRADPLGLLRREQSLTEPELLYVHPRTVKVEGSASGLIRDLEGATIRKLSDNDVAFHALRNYVPGDDRRYIHWKSTARTGSVMVRQFEETRRSHMLVALSTRLHDYADDDEFESAVSIAASLGMQTLLEGQTLTAVTSTRQLRHRTAKQLLDQYAGVDYERAAPPLSEVARRIARAHADASVAVIVCGSLLETAEIRKARRFLPIDLRTIVVRSEPAAETTLRQMGDLDVATLGDLDDLGTTLRRLTR